MRKTIVVYFCVCTTSIPDACRDQKQALYTQKLEIQMVGGCHVGAGSCALNH